MKIRDVAETALELVEQYGEATAKASSAQELATLEPDVEVVVATLTTLADHILATQGEEARAVFPVEPAQMFATTRQARRYLVMREVLATINGAVSFGRPDGVELVWLEIKGFDLEAAVAHNDRQCDAEIARLEAVPS